jgi:hypothetical protein
VVRLSALGTGRVYPPGNIPGTHFCYRLSRPQGHSATERIMSMKNTNYTIGNRTRDLPACGAVSQPTAPSRPPLLNRGYINLPSVMLYFGHRQITINLTELNLRHCIVTNVLLLQMSLNNSNMNGRRNRFTKSAQNKYYSYVEKTSIILECHINCCVNK